MLSPAYRNVKMNSDEQQAMFSREVQGTFMLTVEFKKIIVLGKFTKFIT